MTMLLCCAAVAASASPRETGAVSIRIHDYSHLDGRLLRRAQRQVAQMYEHIDVRLDWRTPARPGEIAAGHAKWPSDGTTALTIVVLDAAMADKLAVPDDVAGYAPITRERGGRIAFVFGERVRGIAATEGLDTSDVLTGVIAHEVAHLLMPQRSHSSEGVMRANWAPEEFRQVRRQRFSDIEAASIRQRVRAISGEPSRVAD